MRLSSSLCVLAPAVLICLGLHQANSAPEQVRKKRTLGLIEKILNPHRCGGSCCGGSCCGGSCSRGNYNSAASNLGITGPLALFKFNLGGSLANAESAAHGGGGGFGGSGSSAAANANSFGGGGGGGFSNSQASSNAASQSHGFGGGGGSAAQASSHAQSGAYTNFHNQGFGGAFFPQPIRPYQPNHNQIGCGYGGSCRGFRRFY